MWQAPQTSEEIKPGPQHTRTHTGIPTVMKLRMEIRSKGAKGRANNTNVH